MILSLSSSFLNIYNTILDNFITNRLLLKMVNCIQIACLNIALVNGLFSLSYFAQIIQII